MEKIAVEEYISLGLSELQFISWDKQQTSGQE